MESGHRSKFDYKELGIALLCLIVLAQTAAIAFILLSQKSNNDTLKEVKQSNQILIDCTTPGHKCYENGTKNTAKAIQQLNNYQKAVSIVTAHCAAIGYYNVSDIEACVNKILNK